MHALWHWLLYVLAWAAHDPASLDAERARCAGAVNVAYAAFAQEPAPAPRREPEAAPVPDLPPLPPAAPCLQCSGTGRIYRSDGGWVRCPCGACPTGRCPQKR
jgi:hypothetical protein